MSSSPAAVRVENVSLPSALRAIRGIHSQRDIAEACCHTQAWWSRLERGLCDPTVADLELLSQLGLTIYQGRWAVLERAETDA